MMSVTSSAESDGTPRPATTRNPLAEDDPAVLVTTGSRACRIGIQPPLEVVALDDQSEPGISSVALPSGRMSTMTAPSRLAGAPGTE